MNNLEKEIKELIVQSLNLEDIGVDDISSEEPLFIDGLGLDSIDALELGMALQKKYGIKIESQNEDIKKYFFSIKTIAEFVGKKRA
ncbi:MAG TPA: phosphopantetheine-binding protein [Alphaproteobacteria bacterium]|nr:phosphopantetheine-binding protein [Alphaproteobacteria bacterium]